MNYLPLFYKLIIYKLINFPINLAPNFQRQVDTKFQIRKYDKLFSLH